MKQTKSTPEKRQPNPTSTSSKNYKLIVTTNFIKEAKKLKKKYPNIKGDFYELGKDLKKDPITGHDSLGKDCYKVRMAITDKGQGESGGARIIIQVRVVGRKVYLLSVYDKGVDSVHVDPGFWDVDPPAKQALRVRAFAD